MHVPRDLHFEIFDRLDTRPGETPAAKAGRLVAFYADTMTQLPATQAVGDPYKFWKTAFAAWIAREASRPVVDRVAAAIAPPAYDLIWQQIRAGIETRVDRAAFYTWFRPLVMVTDGTTTGARVIQVTKPGPEGGHFVRWIHTHFADVVQAAADEVCPGARVDVIDAWAAESEAAARDRRSG